MTAMAELTENTVLPVEQESDTAAVKDQTSLIGAFESALEISQDVEPTEGAASEDTDRQQDGQMVSDSTRTESKTQWTVGAQCRAVWSEDGLVYPATVESVDGDRCTVRFDGYGNEEDVELSALRSPALQTQRQNSEVWRPGSRCRAVYSEDGLVYPAVILWVKGQRCCVRFDNYNNEEEQEVDSLLTVDELHGPSRAAAAKGFSWKSSGSSSNSDWKRRRRQESQGEEGGGGGGVRRSAWRDDQLNSSWDGSQVKLSNQSRVEKESEEKKQRDGAQKATFFPPFPPPPPQLGSVDPVSFIPPPPPLGPFGGKELGSADASSSMLMLWYMCGFHTGSYMAQQAFKSSSTD